MDFAWRILRNAAGAVTVHRPFDPDRAMIGCPIAEAASRAARLHALCPTAHRIAVETALGADATPDHVAALDREAAFVCALRFGLHWPLAFGHKPDARLADARAAAAAEDDQRLADTLHALAASAAAQMWADAAAKALSDLADPQAPRRPLAARLDTLLTDALRRAAALRRGVRLATISARPGQASIATARGDLDVRLTVQAGQIAAFHSRAPTDRLFAGNGPAATLIAAARDAPQARLALLALDPCAPAHVEFQRETAHA
jgi:hypothetical protein